MSVLSIITAMLSMSASAAAPLQGVMPPVPVSRIEILSPTARSHRIVPRCGTSKNLISWNFDGKAARFSSVRLLGVQFSKSDLAKLDDAARAMGVDVFVRIECDGGAVSMTLLHANGIGSMQVKMIDFDYDDTGLRRVGEEGFTGLPPR